MSLSRFIRPDILAMKGYHLDYHPHKIKLDQNENPFDVPDALKAHILEKINTVQWGRYPEYSSSNLVKAIAKYASANTEQILVGHGSNSLILTTLLAAIQPGDVVMCPAPAFSLYSVMAQSAHAKVEFFSLHPETFDLQLDNMLRQIEKYQPKIIFLCSPNNPTGNAFKIEDLEKVAATAPGLVVIDEAYQEFHQENVDSLLPKYNNLVILRTFSKALSMAGFRLGYLLADPELVAEFRKTIVPYNVNISAQIAVTEILKYPDLIQERIEIILQQRERLWHELSCLQQLRFYPSHANFFLMRSPNGEHAFKFLLAAGILARDVSSYPGLKNCLRINIGTPDENNILLDQLHKLEQIL